VYTTAASDAAFLVRGGACAVDRGGGGAPAMGSNPLYPLVTTRVGVWLNLKSWRLSHELVGVNVLVIRF
jgi:hypothetical protein